MTTATATKPKEQTKVVTKQVSEMPDFSKMSMSERLDWIENFKEDTIAASQKEFEEAINYTAKTAKSLGRTMFDVMNGFFTMLPSEEKKEFVARFAAANGFRPPATPGKPRDPNKPAAAGKTPADIDKTGARPTPGKTYVINGMEWTKAASGKGRAKNDFIDAIKGGATWVEMEKKK